MSKYTLELRYMYEDKNFNLFDFPYNLYDNDLKPWFEEKFFQHFMFYEIGFDTIGMFKQRLMSKLNDIFPYYKQLYETEIRSKNIDFMLNKDLKESYVRELTSSTNNLSFFSKLLLRPWKDKTSLSSSYLYSFNLSAM